MGTSGEESRRGGEENWPLIFSVTHIKDVEGGEIRDASSVYHNLGSCKEARKNNISWIELEHITDWEDLIQSF